MFVIRAYCNKFTHTKSRLCHVDFLRKNEKLRRKMKEIKNPPSPNTLVLIKRINQRKYNSSTHNFFAFLPFEKRERGREGEREGPNNAVGSTSCSARRRFRTVARASLRCVLCPPNDGAEMRGERSQLLRKRRVNS